MKINKNVIVCQCKSHKYKKAIVGICVDATSLTLVPVAADGRVLAQMPEFTGQHHAQIKLWKYHRAQAQADEALILARKMNEKFLGRTGGTISCEWTLSKLLKMRDEASAVYSKIDVAFDLCEFLTFRLTGSLARSAGSMCYKGPTAYAGICKSFESKNTGGTGWRGTGPWGGNLCGSSSRPL